jgi:hypothetical protein
MSLPHEIAEQQATAAARSRAAAKACADFHFPTLKAVAQIKDKDFSSMVEA